VAIILTLIISKIINSRIGAFIERGWEWKNREELAWVMTRTANITVLSIGFTIVLSILWIDMWIFLWGLWFWIWFTLKIFLSNFIWWIIMVTQWSYHNWDVIKIWDKTWKIRKINSLFTEIEQFNWVIFFVPNVKFLENEVENININDKRRIEIKVWVDYETDIVKAKKIMLQVINNFPWILKTPEPGVIITDFNDSSIDLNLKFWINSRWDFVWTKSNVTETINLAFRQYWISIPFPQITLSNRSDFKIDLKK
jgi:small-conductance mechanosensitive channel